MTRFVCPAAPATRPLNRIVNHTSLSPFTRHSQKNKLWIDDELRSVNLFQERPLVASGLGLCPSLKPHFRSRGPSRFRLSSEGRFIFLRRKRVGRDNRGGGGRREIDPVRCPSASTSIAAATTFEDMVSLRLTKILTPSSSKSPIKSLPSEDTCRLDDFIRVARNGVLSGWLFSRACRTVKYVTTTVSSPHEPGCLLVIQSREILFFSIELH